MGDGSRRGPNHGPGGPSGCKPGAAGGLGAGAAPWFAVRVVGPQTGACGLVAGTPEVPVGAAPWFVVCVWALRTGRSQTWTFPAAPGGLRCATINPRVAAILAECTEGCPVNCWSRVRRSCRARCDHGVGVFLDSLVHRTEPAPGGQADHRVVTRGCGPGPRGRPWSKSCCGRPSCTAACSTRRDGKPGECR
jgi:hypothetical protein